jgi:hypothetical protein
MARQWLFAAILELSYLTFSLMGISIARRWLPNADFAVRWPGGKTLMAKALVWGIAFGAIMLLADRGASLVRGWVPKTPAHGAVDVAGWLAFELLLGVLEALSIARTVRKLLD